MTQRMVEITTPDGICPAVLSIPEGEGPWPAVIFCHDVGGVRDTMREMADRLCSMGYVVLLPDFYYRHGAYEPQNKDTTPESKAELIKMGRGYTADATMIARDAPAWADYLDSLPEKKPGGIGTTGYCLGGWVSLMTAADLGERVMAAASFHGSALVKHGNPDCPLNRANDIKATVYIGMPINDDDHGFGEADKNLFVKAFTEAGVPITVELYQALHGFAVPDQYQYYDQAAADRHWQATKDLFGSVLGS